MLKFVYLGGCVTEYPMEFALVPGRQHEPSGKQEVLDAKVFVRTNV
jgi:hypothetical protein